MQGAHMEKRICPVCGMDTRDSTISAVHLGIEYYFCTPQCRENFRARPKLYVGRQSAKYAGREIIKCRAFLLDLAVDSSVEHQLEASVHQLMGVREVRIKGRKIVISYNLLEATAEQMERALSDAGAALAVGLGARLKRGWLHYTEETELDNLATDDAACCNKPPGK